MDSIPHIFISIASYRDSELIHTLDDMITQSACAQSLHIGICWQCEEDIFIFLNQGMHLTQQHLHNGFNLYVFSYKNAVIQVISVHYYLSQGACWARHLAESLYDNEEFFLQIDSHCRFVPSWDSQMIEMLENLTAQSPKPVITGYPPGYQPDKPDEKSTHLVRIIFRSFSSKKILQLSPLVIKSTVSSPIRGSYIAGGFIFSFGHFVTDVPNDPQIFFEGEEISMSVRAFTHGYDVYHPDRILLWHFYGRGEHAKIWSDHGQKAKSDGDVDQAWWERDALSKKRVTALLGQEGNAPCDSGIYCLGKQRTLSQFERNAGVDFSRCLVHPDVVGDQHKTYFACGELLEGVWRSQLVGVRKKNLEFKVSRIRLLGRDVLYWYIGIYTNKNILLEQLTIYREEIDEKISKSDNGGFSIPLNFTSEESLPPYSIRISPFIERVGWGKMIEELW